MLQCMSFDVNQIISYREMCNAEEQSQLQAGMNFGIGGSYSVVLMSVKANAPYEDRISDDGLTIYYEGHDMPGDKSKRQDQPAFWPSGKPRQNGLFVTAIEESRVSKLFPLTKVYEKLQMGIWTYRGLFEMRDYSVVARDGRNVFEFVFTITEQVLEEAEKHRTSKQIDVEQTRQIPGRVKLAVFKRDKGMCTMCGKKDNLHFDHILPYSKGGTSLKKENIQILCSRHNLEKSAKLDY